MEERETEKARSGTTADEPRDIPRICDKPDSEMVGAVYETLDKQKDKNMPVQSRKNCIAVLGRDPVFAGKIHCQTGRMSRALCRGINQRNCETGQI